MDQKQNLKNHRSLSQFIKSQFHRKLITQLLVSVSVFSLFLSHSYCLSLLHPFKFNFHDTLPFQLFRHSIDKNFIFLLCNGLLVFVVKYSGLISSSSKYNLNDDHSFNSYEEDIPQSESTSFEPKPSLSDKEIAMESANEALENTTLMERTQEKEEEDGKKWGLIIIHKEVEEKEDQNSAFAEYHEEELEKGSENELSVQKLEQNENYEEEEEEVESVEENRVLSTEELNKKFDEFIRKMKEELRIEARQQLVMV